MQRIIVARNVPYLPLPNSITFVRTSELAPVELTKTSFMVVLKPNGDVVLANNRRRGPEVSGGHVEPGETLTSGAHREAFEETGHWVSHIKPIGYLEMWSEGEVPDGWKYPHPLSYQQFFAGDSLWNEPYVENDECLSPVVLRDISVLTDERQLIVRIARLAMGFIHTSNGKYLCKPVSAEKTENGVLVTAQRGDGSTFTYYSATPGRHGFPAPLATWLDWSIEKRDEIQAHLDHWKAKEIIPGQEIETFTLKDGSSYTVDQAELKAKMIIRYEEDLVKAQLRVDKELVNSQKMVDISP